MYESVHNKQYCLYKRVYGVTFIEMHRENRYTPVSPYYKHIGHDFCTMAHLVLTIIIFVMLIRTEMANRR